MGFRNKTLIFQLASVLAIFAIVFFVAIPSIKDIRDIKEKITIEKKELELKYQKGILLNEMRKNIEELQDNKNQLEEIFIAPGGELEYVNELEKIAGILDVGIILNIENKKITQGGKIRKLPLIINLEGNFIQVMKFLNQIETQKKYLNISSLEFSKRGSGGDVQLMALGVVYSKVNENEIEQK